MERGREFGVDSSRIVLAGHSAGAHLVSLLATDRSWLGRVGVPHSVVKGVISISGVYDLNMLVVTGAFHRFQSELG